MYDAKTRKGDDREREREKEGESGMSMGKGSRRMFEIFPDSREARARWEIFIDSSAETRISLRVNMISLLPRAVLYILFARVQHL